MVMDSTKTNLTSDSIVNTGITALNWFETNYFIFIKLIIIVVIAIIATRILSEILSRLLGRTIREDMYPSKTDRDRRLRTITSIATAIVTFIVWTVAFLTILSTIGVNTAPLIASAGIFGIAIGFGAQSLVKDFMTGLFIIAENQYRVGDYVEIQNIKGTVKAVTMRTTIIADDDGSVFHIPNGSIIVTGNHTMGNNKISIELSATTETDIEKLKDIIDKIGKSQASHATTKDFIVEPLRFIRIKDITSGSIIIRISGKVKPGKQATIRSDYFVALQKELIKNKIALK
jgi:small-conductance mechanosensitive channel